MQSYFDKYSPVLIVLDEPFARLQETWVWKLIWLQDITPALLDKEEVCKLRVGGSKTQDRAGVELWVAKSKGS